MLLTEYRFKEGVTMENALNWLGDKGLELIGGGIVGVCKLLAGQTTVFVIVAIAGAYFIMMGYKDTGNKIISTSVITYLILKVVSLAC